MARLAYGIGLLAAWSLAEVAGCDAIPPLQFVEAGTSGDSTMEDSTVAGDSPTDDGGSGIDGMIGDDGSQSPDGLGGATDASPEAGCTGTQPLGAMVCCGTIWCVGECDANCGACSKMCSPLNFCCDKAGFGATCKPLGASPLPCRQ